MFKKAGNTLIDAIFYQKEDNQTPKESSIISLCNAKIKDAKIISDNTKSARSYCRRYAAAI